MYSPVASPWQPWLHKNIPDDQQLHSHVNCTLGRPPDNSWRRPPCPPRSLGQRRPTGRSVEAARHQAWSSRSDALRPSHGRVDDNDDNDDGRKRDRELSKNERKITTDHRKRLDPSPISPGGSPEGILIRWRYLKVPYKTNLSVLLLYSKHALLWLLYFCFILTSENSLVLDPCPADKLNILSNNTKRRSKVHISATVENPLFKSNYTVSQKTSHLWLAITLTHMNGFSYFWKTCYR